MLADVRYLLLQIRDATDPMRPQEIACFANALGCNQSAIGVHDLLAGRPDLKTLQSVEVVLVGGSGDYSVVSGGDWLPAALATMRDLVECDIATFASCWGFQALALALGGEVVTDLTRAEIGTHELSVAHVGKADPLFADLPEPFLAQMGHQDIVVKLPKQAELLASSELVKNQALRIRGRRIYATQFHPELDRSALVERLSAYPQYVESVVGIPIDEFTDTCREAPESQQLLPRFVNWAIN